MRNISQMQYEYQTTRGVIQNDCSYQAIGTDMPRRYVDYNDVPKNVKKLPPVERSRKNSRAWKRSLY